LRCLLNLGPFSDAEEEDLPGGSDIPDLSKPSKGFSKHLKQLRTKLEHLVDSEDIADNFSGDTATSGKESLVINETFEGTWLGDPKRADFVVGDWEPAKSRFPNAKNIMGGMPFDTRDQKALPVSIPLRFADEKVEKFFNKHSKIYEGTKITLPMDVFSTTEITASTPETRLLLLERFVKIQLKESLALKALSGESFKKLKSIHDLLSKPNPPAINWKEEIETLYNLNYLSSNLAIRGKHMSCTNMMMVRSGLRESVLSRCTGRVEAKSAARMSNFGSPSLFGPVNSDMEQRVRDHRWENQKYQLKTPASGTKRSGDYLPSAPFVKRQASGASSFVKQSTPSFSRAGTQ